MSITHWTALGNAVAFAVAGYYVVTWYEAGDLLHAIFWLLLAGWFWLGILGNVAHLVATRRL